MVRQQRGSSTDGAQMTHSANAGRVTVGPVTVLSKQPVVRGAAASRHNRAVRMYLSITLAGA